MDAETKTYRKIQFSTIDNEFFNEDDVFSMKIKRCSGNKEGETKWMTITGRELNRINRLLSGEVLNFTDSIFTNEHGERDKGGRIVCSVCDYRGGIRISKYRGGKMPAGSEYTRDSSKWTDRYTCPICGSTERHYIYTGVIFDQIIHPVVVKEADNGHIQALKLHQNI